MRPLVLALALAALLAPAHPASFVKPELEKKLDDTVKEILDKDPKAPEEPIDQANTIQDIDNQLKKAEPIPVKVVVEDVQPVLKGDLAAEDGAIKRVEVDLKHPGEPQRQEHETQNPEHYEDEQGAVAALKQMIKDTQVVFNKGFADVSERIVDWVHDNKPEVTIIDSIQHLRQAFTENMDKINSTIQGYWNQADDSEKKVDIQKVQSGLKVLEEKFESGVATLNNGVRNLAVLKETRDDTSTTTAKPAQGIQFPGFVTNFWNSVTQGFGNVTNQFQNIIGQSGNTTTGVGVQSDETSASSSKPSVWQGIQNQIQGIFQGRPQGAQSDEQPAQTGPFAQVIQNVPLLQNFVNFIQPKPQAPEPAQSTNTAGSNVVPAEPPKPADQQQKKPDENPVAPVAQPTAQPAAQGPIQQIIQKNPIVQGIAGAVQKIQHSITNPEKPREEVDQKGGFFPWHYGGHKPGNGDNNNVDNSGVKSAPIEAEKSSLEASPIQEAVPASPEAAPASPEAAPASPEAVKQD